MVKMRQWKYHEMKLKKQLKDAKVKVHEDQVMKVRDD